MKLFGLLPIVTAVLIVLKLAGISNITWLTVFSPMLIGAGIAVVLLLLSAVLLYIAHKL